MLVITPNSLKKDDLYKYVIYYLRKIFIVLQIMSFNIDLDTEYLVDINKDFSRENIRDLSNNSQILMCKLYK